MLALVAAVERESEHPLAQAVVIAAEARDAAVMPVTDFDSVPGHGAVATVDARRVAVGNRRLMERENDRPRRTHSAAGRSSPASGRTAVIVAVDGSLSG